MFSSMSRKDRKRWPKVASLAEYGQLTAQWLEGEVASQPNYLANTGPDEETKLLVPFLAALNRSGFVTRSSQPGCTPDQREYGGIRAMQRANVTGYASERFHQVAEALIAPTGLTMLAFAPGAGERYDDIFQHAVVVSQDYGRDLDWRDPPGTHQPDELVDVTYSGCCVPPEDIAERYSGFDRRLIASLQASWQIAIFDPEWGRNDRLWPFLTEVVAQLS